MLLSYCIGITYQYVIVLNQVPVNCVSIHLNTTTFGQEHAKVLEFLVGIYKEQGWSRILDMESDYGYRDDECGRRVESVTFVYCSGAIRETFLTPFLLIVLLALHGPGYRLDSSISAASRTLASRPTIKEMQHTQLPNPFQCSPSGKALP